jgi:hypothetical protein
VRDLVIAADWAEPGRMGGHPERYGPPTGYPGTVRESA